MTRPLSSLRARILLLVMLAVLPALLLLLSSTRSQRAAARSETQAQALRLSRLAASNQERQLEAARQLLATLARLPEVRGANVEECNELFAGFLTEESSYLNLGAVAPNGDVYCSALPAATGVNLSDRSYFRDALRTRRFAIGEYQIGRITGLPALNFGYPVLGRGSEVEGMVFAALDLGVLNRIAAEADLPPGGSLVLTDRDGTILARHPDPDRWVGRRLPDTPLVRTILRRREGVAETTGLDGVERIYAVTPLGGAGPNDAFVAIGIAKSQAFAASDRAFRRGVLILALVALGTLLAGWLGSYLFVLRRVRALVATTRRFGEGDLSARTGLADSRGELGELASSFDQMADSLQRRTEELAALTHTLEEQVHERTEELAEAKRELELTMLTVREAYESEREANERLVALDELKNEFVAMVAHDLRSPMATIGGFAEILQSHWDRLPDEQRQEFLETIVRQVGALADLIEDILSVARIESGEFSYDVRPFDLGRLILRTAEEIEAANTSSRVEARLPDRLPQALGDEQRMWQVLTNLLSNAVKFSPEGSEVTVEVELREGELVVTVRDRGTGIAPDDMHKLFQKFGRIAPREGQVEVKGTGLGLYICKAIVEAQGGRIWAESTPGEGSTFACTLPVAREGQG